MAIEEKLNEIRYLVEKGIDEQGLLESYRSSAPSNFPQKFSPV